jgi:hypothetical protein
MKWSVHGGGWRVDLAKQYGDSQQKAAPRPTARKHTPAVKSRSKNPGARRPHPDRATGA